MEQGLHVTVVLFREGASMEVGEDLVELFLNLADFGDDRAKIFFDGSVFVSDFARLKCVAFM